MLCRCGSAFGKVEPSAEYLPQQVTPSLERTVACAGSQLSSLFITQHSQCVIVGISSEAAGAHLSQNTAPL